MSVERPETARITVWYPRGALTGRWHPARYILFAWEHYEYGVGVPATVEYRKTVRNKAHD